jgi:hypothetical protein
VGELSVGAVVVDGGHGRASERGQFGEEHYSADPPLQTHRSEEQHETTTHTTGLHEAVRLGRPLEGEGRGNAETEDAGPGVCG